MCRPNVSSTRWSKMPLSASPCSLWQCETFCSFFFCVIVWSLGYHKRCFDKWSIHCQVLIHNYLKSTQFSLNLAQKSRKMLQFRIKVRRSLGRIWCRTEILSLSKREWHQTVNSWQPILINKKYHVTTHPNTHTIMTVALVKDVDTKHRWWVLNSLWSPYMHSGSLLGMLNNKSIPV